MHIPMNHAPNVFIMFQLLKNLIIAHIEPSITPRPISAPMSNGNIAPNAPAELPNTIGVIANVSIVFIFYSSSYIHVWFWFSLVLPSSS